jgi:hypothetical protein
MITNAMYNDEMVKYEPFYGVESPTDFHSWGHFTQIVWKGTQKVGCYTHKCGALVDPNHYEPVANVEYTVCNYSPPGKIAPFPAYSLDGFG